MGKIKKPLPVKLIFSLLTNSEILITETIKEIEYNFGEVEEVSEKFTFNHTNYYEPEMGKNLFRRFVILKKLFPRENIAKVKIITNNIEEKFSINGKRKINIDPGYLTLENFILFTTKNYTHRIYLEKGIYADLTLIYHRKQYNPLEWTYPDYAENSIRNYLKTIREKYKNQLKDYL